MATASSAPAVFILGGYQTDFSRNFSREGLDISDLMKETADGAFAAAGVEPEQVDVAHIGNFVGDLFAGQAHLGGVLAEVVPALSGIAMNRHEAACASGSMAIMAAMADLESGRYNLALVLGLEYMRNVPGSEGAGHLATAAWVGKESQSAKFLWPSQFSEIADEYERRYGLDQQHLGGIANINYDNAKRNPNSQTRGWKYGPENFTADDDANPIVEGRTRRFDCSQVTDGGSAIFLANEATAKAWANKRGVALESIPRISGWGHRSAGISLGNKLANAADSDLLFPHVAQAINDAQKRAGISNDDLSAIETHDCFTISEYMAIDHFGITAPGEAWRVVEDGTIAFDGSLPINASGGLIGMGHPVGATGIRMVLDGYKQVTGTAGDYQVDDATAVQTLNIGGSTATVASFVVAR